MATAIHDLTRTDTETESFFSVSVTLAEVEAAGIELDGAFGIDADEHAELIHDPEILRVRFGVACSCDDGQWAAREFAEVETLQSTLSHPEPRWTPCTATYYSAAGSKDRNDHARNNARVDALLRSRVPNLADLIGEAEAVHEEWIAEANAAG